VASGLAHARDVAAAHGRAPVTGAVYLWAAVDRDGARARRTAVEAVSRIYHQDFQPHADSYLVAGDPAAVTRRIREYAAAGAEQVLVGLACPADAVAETRMATLLAEEVLPDLRAGPA